MDVELLEISNAADNKATGMLSWKLNLAPWEIKKLRVSYSVKSPINKLLNLD